MNSKDDFLRDKNEGVLKPLGISSSVSIIYIIVFVTISLVIGKNITMDKVALPAIFLYLIISAIEYFFSKKNKSVPKIFSVVSFTLALIVALIMALVMP